MPDYDNKIYTDTRKGWSKEIFLFSTSASAVKKKKTAKPFGFYLVYSYKFCKMNEKKRETENRKEWEKTNYFLKLYLLEIKTSNSIYF